MAFALPLLPNGFGLVARDDDIGAATLLLERLEECMTDPGIQTAGVRHANGQTKLDLGIRSDLDAPGKARAQATIRTFKAGTGKSALLQADALLPLLRLRTVALFRLAATQAVRCEVVLDDDASWLVPDPARGRLVEILSRS